MPCVSEVVTEVAMMQCLYDCHRASFWPRAKVLSQPVSPPLHPPDTPGHMLGVIVFTATQLAALQIYLVLL